MVMETTYLSEAFKQLEILNEEDFKLDDNNIDDIKAFIDTDEKTDFVDIIDPDAESEEELEDSYIGKVILDCCVCHSKIYKAADEVELEDDEELANIGEECPFCYSTDGYTVVGQVAPFEQESELKVEVEDKPEEKEEDDDEDDDDDDKEKNESLKHANHKKINEAKQLCKKCGKVVEKPCKKCEDELEEANDRKRYKISHKDNEGNVTGVNFANLTDKEAANAKRYNNEFKVNKDIELDEGNRAKYVGIQRDLTGKAVKTADRYDKLASVASNTETEKRLKAKAHDAHAEANRRSTDADSYDDEIHNDLPKSVSFSFPDEIHNRGSKSLDDWYDNDQDSLIAAIDNKLKAIYKTDTITWNWDNSRDDNVIDIYDIEWDRDTNANAKASANRYKNKFYSKDADKLANKEPGTVKKLAQEGLNEARWKETINAGSALRDAIDAEDYQGILEGIKACYQEMFDKGVIDEDDLTSWVEDLDILDADDEDIEDSLNYELDNLYDACDNLNCWLALNEGCTKKGAKAKAKKNEGFEKVELETDDKVIKVTEEPKEEVPNAEMVAPIEPETKDEIEAAQEPEENEIDLDVNDFGEDEFDELGEAYLKKTYENVDSFKTASVKSNGNQLVIEGVIKFNSGKEKQTQFVFESKDITKSGKARFIGENTQISRGKKSFTLCGNLTEGKFIAESLNYNYRAKNESGKSSRVYGTVKVLSEAERKKAPRATEKDNEKIMCKVNELGGKYSNIVDDFAVTESGKIINTKTGKLRTPNDSGNGLYTNANYIQLPNKKGSKPANPKFKYDDFQNDVEGYIRSHQQ